jgi:hypothetical protein
MTARSTPRLVAWTTCATTIALAVGQLVLSIIQPDVPPGADVGGASVAVAALSALMLTSFAILGAVVASRQPRNAVGWLLCLIPLSFGSLFVANNLYWHLTLQPGDAPGIATYAAWLANWAWIPSIVAAFTFLPLLFPTGRPLSRRWRPVVAFAIFAGVMTFIGTAFVPGPLAEYDAVVNPLGIEGISDETFGAVAFLCLVPTALASIASLVIRYRRSHGIEHQQIKWVAAAAALLPVGFSGAGFGGDAGFAVLVLGLLVFALAVSVAMLRYRLYDIDVVINRTLVYGALTALLAGAYLGSVLLLQLVLSPSSDLAIAGSTLAVAGLFRPARGRIQALVDRRFFRRKYDAKGTLAAFSARLRDEVSLDALDAELRAVVTDTVQPAHVSVWMRPR